MAAISNTSGDSRPSNDHGYDEFRSAVQMHFAEVRDEPLFTTDAHDLFDVFLAHLPAEHRQHYTCNNCRTFCERFGGLVTIENSGKARSAFWNAKAVPAFYSDAVAAMAKLVEKSQVTGVFYSEDRVWGVPENVSKSTGIAWTHFFVEPAPARVFKRTVLKNADQAMAERREEFGMLQRGLAEFEEGHAISALALLKSGNLPRAEKALGVAEWFVDLHAKLTSKRGRAKNNNLVWLAVATAPVGFAHVKASMIGTLLEDVRAGLPFDDIKAKWAEKVDPLKYLRPQSDPGAGNIVQGEKVVAALRSAGALLRKLARPDEVQALWRPREPHVAAVQADAGVFAHIRPKGKRGHGVEVGVEQPAVTMTFEKFRREVLPGACSMFADVPRHGNFIAIVTAADPEAPPILQWDMEDARNPFNWYVWPGGSPAAQWGLDVVGDHGYVKVTAVCLLPCMWNEKVDHGNHGKGAILLLEGCKESRFTGGVALFPEVLKAEYHAVRKTIEAFSRSAVFEGVDDGPAACGLDLRAGRTWDQRVHVIDVHGMRTTYNLDRWD